MENGNSPLFYLFLKEAGTFSVGEGGYSCTLAHIKGHGKWEFAPFLLVSKRSWDLLCRRGVLLIDLFVEKGSIPFPQPAFTKLYWVINFYLNAKEVNKCPDVLAGTYRRDFSKLFIHSSLSIMNSTCGAQYTI